MPDIGDSGKVENPIRLYILNIPENILLRSDIQTEEVITGRDFGNVRIGRPPNAVFRRSQEFPEMTADKSGRSGYKDVQTKSFLSSIPANPGEIGETESGVPILSIF